MDANLDAEDLALIDGPSTGTDLAIVGGAYEGASRFDKTVSLWTPPLRSADADIREDKATADGRTRDILRNDSYVAGGAAIHKDSIVGDMYVVNAKPATTVLGMDEVWEEEFQKEVEEKFTLVAESPNCYFDASRRNTLTGIIRLAVGVHTMSGEFLATAEWMRDTSLPFRTAIQIVDLDRLSNPIGVQDSPTMRSGIETDRYGAPIAAWIRAGHPTDYGNPDSWKHIRVPWRKPWGRLQVIHVLEQMRPDQTRGISAMVSALQEMQITKKFRKIVLQNAVVNATYAASIESDLPSEAAFAAIGGGADASEAIARYASSYLGAVAQYAGNSRNLLLDGVKIPHLFPGTKLQLRNAGTPGGVGSQFEESLLRYIAASLDVSYEELSRDYSKTNYSSARAAMLQTYKSSRARKRLVADRVASSIYRLWLEEAINKGEITSLSKKGPSWYDGINADAYSACEWIGAGRGQIDELKETQAAVLRLNNNLSTHEDELGRLGKDWRKVFAQREREAADLEERGLTVIADPNMVNALSASPQDTGNGGQDGASGNGDQSGN